MNNREMVDKQEALAGTLEEISSCVKVHQIKHRLGHLEAHSLTLNEVMETKSTETQEVVSKLGTLEAN